MLGALALLALSSTAEDQDKAIDLAGKDILIREVRSVKGGKKKRKSQPEKRRTSEKKNDKKKKSRQIKRKGRKRNRKGKQGGRRNGRKEGIEKNGKKKKGSPKGQLGKRKRTRKGGKSLANGRNTRYDDCPAFYNQADTTAVRDFRYARNQIQKARRAQNNLKKLEKLTVKALTAFLAGAAFYKDCSDPRAPAVYEGLSQCNVTAAAACNPAYLQILPAYANLSYCIGALETTMESSENCLSKGACGDDGPCEYKPIGMVNDPRTCDYVVFGREVADRLNKYCTNSTYAGSFTYCNNLLKDSYPIASSCSYPPTVTTLAPSSGRLRKNLNIWKI